MRVFLLEFLDASRSVDDLLLAGVKRMALGAHLDVDILTHGRAGYEFAATAANNIYVFVFRMNFVFHNLVLDCSVARKDGDYPLPGTELQGEGEHLNRKQAAF